MKQISLRNNNIRLFTQIFIFNRYAHGLVSEYLEDELANKLLQHLNLPEEPKAATAKDNNRKRKLSGSNQSEINKSSRQDESASDAILDLTKPEKVIN